MESKTGFFDFSLFVITLAVAFFSAVDWSLSSTRRKQLKETVGDFWTFLQYNSLAAAYVALLSKIHFLLEKLLGTRIFAAKFVLLSAVINGSFPILLFLIVFASNRSAFYDLFQFIPFVTYYGIVATFFALNLLLAWIPLASLVWTLRRMSVRADWTCIFSIFTSLIVLATSSVVLSFVVYAAVGVAFIMYSGSASELEQFVEQFKDSPSNISQLSFEQTMQLPTTKYVFPLAVTLLATIILWLAQFAGLISSVFVLAFLKLFRPILQPLVSFVLARLYESEKGVLTQIAVGLGGLLKIIQEVSKYIT